MCDGEKWLAGVRAVQQIAACQDALPFLLTGCLEMLLRRLTDRKNTLIGLH